MSDLDHSLMVVGFHACSPTFNVNSLSSGWHHLAVAQTGGTSGKMEFYINGSKVCEVTNYGSITDIRSIGNYFGGNQEWGAIDEVRIYEQSLTSAQIEKIYYASKKVLEPKAKGSYAEGLEKHRDLAGK